MTTYEEAFQQNNGLMPEEKGLKHILQKLQTQLVHNN